MMQFEAMHDLKAQQKSQKKAMPQNWATISAPLSIWHECMEFIPILN